MVKNLSFVSAIGQLEKIIRRYFQDRDKLERLLARQESLRAGVKDLEAELADLAKRPQLFRTEIGKCQALLIEKHRDLIVGQCRIRTLRVFLAPLTKWVNRLSPEERTFIEYRHLHRYSNYRIGELLHCSEGRVRLMELRIHANLAAWMGYLSLRKGYVTDLQNCDTLVSGNVS